MPRPEAGTDPALIRGLAKLAERDQAQRRALVHLEAAVEGLLAATGSTAETRRVLLAHARQLRLTEGLVRPKTGPRSRRSGPAPFAWP